MTSIGKDHAEPQGTISITTGPVASTNSYIPATPVALRFPNCDSRAILCFPEIC